MTRSEEFEVAQEMEALRKENRELKKALNEACACLGQNTDFCPLDFGELQGFDGCQKHIDDCTSIQYCWYGAFLKKVTE